jgi:hypothetical protein
MACDKTESEVYLCDRIVLKWILWHEMANKRCRPRTFKMSVIRSLKTLEKVLTEYSMS